MTLILIGTSYRSIPLSELEILERSAESIRNSLFEDGTDDYEIEGGVVISTCNRFEIYLDAGDINLAKNRVFAAITSACELDLRYCERNLMVLSGVEAVKRLFQVSVGLDSMVVGEAEIAGQVRRALAESRSLGYTSRIIEALFQRSSGVSKKITNATGLGAAGRSLITSALDIAKSEQFVLTAKKVLVIGTGAYARVVIAALDREGVGEIYVYSPSGRAEKFSENHPTIPIHEANFLEKLTEVDLIVACSGTHGHIVKSEHLKSLGDKILPIIDLSLSPDIEESVKDLSNVHLIDLDLIYKQAPKEHFETISKAEELINAAALEFQDDLVARASDPLVKALRTHVSAIVAEEVDRVRRKKGDLIADEVSRSLQLVTKTIFHKPTIHARSSALQGENDEYQRAIQLLFGLEIAESQDND